MKTVPPFSSHLFSQCDRMCASYVTYTDIGSEVGNGGGGHACSPSGDALVISEACCVKQELLCGNG